MLLLPRRTGRFTVQDGMVNVVDPGLPSTTLNVSEALTWHVWNVKIKQPDAELVNDEKPVKQSFPGAPRGREESKVWRREPGELRCLLVRRMPPIWLPAKSETDSLPSAPVRSAGPSANVGQVK